MPGRYAKNEISDGFVGSIDTYAYRMPVVPGIGVEGPDDVDIPEPQDTDDSLEATAQISGVLDSGPK